MATTTMAVAASSVSVAPQLMPANTLSSSSRVSVNALPIRSHSQVARRSMVVRASKSEEAPLQKVVKSMVAVGAAAALLLGSGDAIAATGPGTSGAERTAQKADDLLTAADKLTTEDSPERFGPGRVGGGDKTESLAQQGGSGVKSGVTSALNKGSDKAGDLVGQAKSGASDVASNVDSAASKSKGFLSSLFGGFGK